MEAVEKKIDKEERRRMINNEITKGFKTEWKKEEQNKKTIQAAVF